MSKKYTDLNSKCTPNWCPGCGNYAMWTAYKRAATQEGWDNGNTAFVADIGCNGHIVNFTEMTSFEGLHGRPLPVASGIKMANTRLNVFAFTGDGGCLGEGGNHFIHACRRNHDITIVLHDNGLYALTTGQTSPVSPHGFKSKSTPQGNYDNPFIPMTLALTAGASFVARAYAGDIPRLSELMIAANNHKGLAFIDVLQPCTTFNKNASHEMYQENTYFLGDEHDKTDFQAAYSKAMEWGENNIPLGIFYQIDKPSYESQLVHLDKPLVEITPKYKEAGKLFDNYK